MSDSILAGIRRMTAIDSGSEVSPPCSVRGELPPRLINSSMLGFAAAALGLRVIAIKLHSPLLSMSARYQKHIDTTSRALPTLWHREAVIRSRPSHGRLHC